MDKFQYKALAPGGEITEDVIDAADRDDVVAFLRSKNFLPISIEPIEPNNSGQALVQPMVADRVPDARLSETGKSRLRRSEIILFTSEFETLLGSGLTVDRALDTLTRTSTNRSLANLAGDLRIKIRSGQSLSAALADYPRTFDAFYLAMIRSGEAGGRLEPTLQRLTNYLDQIDGLISAVRSELTYPAILAGATLVSLGLLFGLVIPQFDILLRGSREDLPFVLQAVFAISGFFQNYGMELVGAVVLAILVSYLVLKRSHRVRRLVDNLVRRVPVLGPIIFYHSIERFCRSVAALLESGLQLSQTLCLAADVCNNQAIATATAEADTAVKQGVPLADAFEDTGIFPPLVVELVRIGEESGQLQPTMTRLADIYGRQIRQSLTRLTTLIGPALITIIGLFIAVIAVTLYSTVLELNLLAG